MRNDVVDWLQERAFRRCGATMNAVHTKTQEWLWADEITRLREENARLRKALEPFSNVFLFPDDLDFQHSEDIRSDPDWDDDANDMQSEDVFVLRRDIRRARAAIREGGKDEN